MNDRTKELAKQAKTYARKQMNHTMVTNLFSAEVFEQKFAELIVQECISEIQHKSVELLDTEFHLHYQERLKKYFGVK